MVGKFKKPFDPKFPQLLETISCISCSAPLSLSAVGHTVTVACPYCQSILDLKENKFSLVLHQTKTRKVTPLIPLGSRGKLHGVLWEVIGFMQRREAIDSKHVWDEYLLFNPKKGFRWLTQNQGHWSYVLSLHENPIKSKDNKYAKYLEEPFKFFHSGSSIVKYVIGEFYWRVKVGDEVRYSDYINPPETLTLEENDKESIWSLAEYIEPSTIESAFNLETRLPFMKGVAQNQPSPSSHVSWYLWWLAGFFISLFILLTLFLSSQSPSKIIYEDTIFFNPQGESSSLEIVSKPFEISQKMGALKFSLESTQLANAWTEIEADLINTKSGETRSFVDGIEYYSGYDDGYWAEGSQFDSVYLSSIPQGEYILDMKVIGDPAAKGIPLKISVEEGVQPLTNLCLALFLILLIPLLIFLRGLFFERKRWKESSAEQEGFLEFISDSWD